MLFFLFRFLILTTRFHWDALKASPANLIMATLSMIINNLLLIWGLWMLLFAGKDSNNPMLPYFWAINAVVAFSWGFVHFFAAGYRHLGETIENGTLESYLAQPTHPLLTLGGAKSSAVALGDLIQASILMVVLAYLYGTGFFARVFMASLISTLAFTGVFILNGSIAFFVKRGNSVANLLNEMILGLSAYPTGKIFTDDRIKVLLLLTPVAATAIAPMEWVDVFQTKWLLISLVTSAFWLALSIVVFQIGRKRFQSSSLSGARLS